MQAIDKRHPAGLLVLLAFLEFISLGGALTVIAMLAGLQSSPISDRRLLLIYGAWFGTSALSCWAMLRWRKWGAYTLAIATAIVTVVDILFGTATLGGASLGLLVAALLVAYLRPQWAQFE